MNVLAADINLIVVVRRDCQRHRPHEAIFEISGDIAAGVIRPHFDIASLSGLQIENLDNATDAAGTGGARPNNIVIDRIGRGPTTLAAGDSDPGAARNRATTTTAATAEAAAASGAAWAAIRGAILAIAVDVIRNLVVGSDVIKLAIRKLNSLPASPARDRETDAGIIRDGHAIRLRRIDPNVVIVAAGTGSKAAATAATSSSTGPGFAPVERNAIRICQKVDFVFIVRRHLETEVIMCAAAHGAIITNQPPVLATVVRSPKFPTISFLSFHRNAITGFNKRVDSIRI